MEKLIKIQSELKAPKNQRNNFGKYNYRSCEDILEAVKPLLTKYKCTLTVSDEVREVCGLVFVEATAIISDGENQVHVKAQAGIDANRKGMDIAQSFGSSSSYARKYALNGLFLIDDTEDADATNTHGKSEKPIPKSEPKKKEIKLGDEGYKAIKKFYQEGKITEDKIKQNYIISDVVLKELIKKQ